MEITLEKIELVKDRTGVSYAEAKEALEKSGGSVVDAIIMIEEQIDISPKTKAGDQASQIVEKIKELVKKGNVSKILIKKDSEIIMNIPVNVGLIGIIFVPWVTLVSVIAALGTKCSIELVKDNGEIVNLSGRAAETFDDMKTNCSVITDDLKEKSEDVFSQAKEKASTVISRIRRDVEDFEDDDYFNFDDFDDSVFDDEPFEEEAAEEDLVDQTETAAEETEEKAEDVVEAAADKAEELAENVIEKTEAAAETAAEKTESMLESAAEGTESVLEATAENVEDAAELLDEKLDAAGNKFEEALEDLKARKSMFNFFE